MEASLWTDKLSHAVKIIPSSDWGIFLPNLDLLIQNKISQLNWDTRRNSKKDKIDAETIVYQLLETIKRSNEN